MNVETNNIIDLYRKKIDQLQNEKIILQAQVDLLQAKLKEADNAKDGESSSTTKK